MKINSQDIFKIKDRAVNEMIDQSSHLYWDTPIGRREIDYDEKRFIAILIAASNVLGLELEIECDEKK